MNCSVMAGPTIFLPPLEACAVMPPLMWLLRMPKVLQSSAPAVAALTFARPSITEAGGRLMSAPVRSSIVAAYCHAMVLCVGWGCCDGGPPKLRKVKVEAGEERD